MFGSAVIKIDFDWIEFVIIDYSKSELDITWFLFGCVNGRSDFEQYLLFDKSESTCVWAENDQNDLKFELI